MKEKDKIDPSKQVIQEIKENWKRGGGFQHTPWNLRIHYTSKKTKRKTKQKSGNMNVFSNIKKKVNIQWCGRIIKSNKKVK